MLYQPNERSLNAKKPFRDKVLDEWIKPMLFALGVVLVINLFFPRYAVQGHSMEPELYENDRLFVSNIEVRTQSIARGSVVVLTAPGDNVTVVKRVIGLPGEIVEVYGGTVYINGQPLEESYIYQRFRLRGRWVVGEDEYFVLGDNRNASRDSSDYGPVSIQRITGVVKFRFWPLNAFHVFSAPEY